MIQMHLQVEYEKAKIHSMKTDIEILIIMIFVAFGCVLLDLPNVLRQLGDYSTKIQQTGKSPQVIGFDNAKKGEKSFWNAITGYKSNTTTLASIEELTNKHAPEPKIPTYVPVKKEKIKLPFKALIVGDSMILEGFGPSLETKLTSYEGLSVVREGRYSTGLNRVDYFDWYSETDRLINENNPDVLIVMLGANDGQGIRDSEGRAIWMDNPAWDEVYRERVLQYLKLTSDRVKLIYWVGHPIPATQDFYDKFVRMNKIYKECSQQFVNVRFVDTWDRFMVNGQYSAVVADNSGLAQVAKQSDGVHVTLHGGGILADLVIDKMKDDIDFTVITPTPTDTSSPTPTQ